MPGTQRDREHETQHSDARFRRVQCRLRGEGSGRTSRPVCDEADVAEGPVDHAFDTLAGGLEFLLGGRSGSTHATGGACTAAQFAWFSSISRVVIAVREIARCIA